MKCSAIVVLLWTLAPFGAAAQDAEAPPPSYRTTADIWRPPPPPLAEPAQNEVDDQAPIGTFVGVGSALGMAFGVAGAFAIANDDNIDPSRPPPPPILLPIGGAIVGAYAGLFAASLHYTFNDEPFPTEWAGLGALMGGISVASGMVALVHGASSDAIAINLLTGAWCIGHAIWSLVAAD